MSIATNLDFLKNLPKVSPFEGPRAESPLVLVDDFGANPGNLAMWCYAPPNLAEGSPLVVLLHGCTQNAVGFDHGSGWTELASRHGFAVLVPEQQRTNNPNLCFNWFDPGKTARGGGEVLSIHRMIATMVRLHRVSSQKICIVGLSAGGAMASAMLAAYPEVFAAGAIIAGLPAGIAGNLREALAAMASAPARSDQLLGSLVRAASSHQGRWPRVSVWHGTADRVVVPDNADRIAAQWRNVHGLPSQATRETVMDGVTRSVWANEKGDAVVERWFIEGMGHGVPLASNGPDSVGVPGPFMLDVGISSTRQIAEFFGLVAPGAAVVTEKKSRSAPRPPERPIGLSAVITRALTAAGLMK